YRHALSRVCSLIMLRRPPRPTPFPYTTLFRSIPARAGESNHDLASVIRGWVHPRACGGESKRSSSIGKIAGPSPRVRGRVGDDRSEEHTSELQSRENLVCRLLLEKKKTKRRPH